jgi:hypothetical protein
MPRKKLSRNARCPCGSGKKYKHCCYGKSFDYEEDEDGTIFKSIPMSQEMVDLLEEQRQEFIQKYGHEPGPNDPIFFDMPHPEQVEHMTVEAMKAAGLDPAIIYAYEKTGRLVTEDNQQLLSDAKASPSAINSSPVSPTTRIIKPTPESWNPLMR